MQLNTYLHFPGTCAEARGFYEKTLGAKTVSSFSYGDSPTSEQFGPDWKDKIMHTSFDVGGTVVMAMDAPLDRYSKPQGFSLSISIGSGAEAERLYNALSEGGSVTMPLQKTFWAARFAMFVDKFGVPWMINCEKE